MICIICGHVISDGSKRCKYCGAKIENAEEESMYQSFGELDKDAVFPLEHDNTWACEFLLSGDENKPYLSMLREKTGETIVIDRFPAVVGRSTKCDYIISGNPTIGRKHILLERRKEAAPDPDADGFEAGVSVPDPDDFERTAFVPDPDDFENAASVPDSDDFENAASIPDSDGSENAASIPDPDGSENAAPIPDSDDLKNSASAGDLRDAASAVVPAAGHGDSGDAASDPANEDWEDGASNAASEGRGDRTPAADPEECIEKLYISDLGSLNHTFIDDVQIKEPVEIYDGIRVLMADEYFVFTILH